jgi:ribosomal-protein-alanine N-acetyltransferase
MNSEPQMIETARLKLIPLRTEHLQAFFRNRQALGCLLGVEVPQDWPVFPESMDYWQGNPDKVSEIGDWTNYLFIHKFDVKVIGDGGFKAKPNADGKTEIGCSIIPGYRGKGLATEAAQALLDWAFAHVEVTTVYAETFPDRRDSMRLVQKLGMSFDGTHHGDAEVEIYSWCTNREEYLAMKNPVPDLTID